MGKKHFCFFETAEAGNRTPNSGVKGSGANHYPRAPALTWQRRGDMGYCWDVNLLTRGPNLDTSESDVNKRQILTLQVDPRTERVKYF